MIGQLETYVVLDGDENIGFCSCCKTAILFRNMHTRSLKLREYSIHQHVTYNSPRPDFGIVTLQLLAGY